jgi:hypothetical protein
MFCELLTLGLLRISQSDKEDPTAQKSRTKLRALATNHLPRVTLWIEDTLCSKVGIRSPKKRPVEISQTTSNYPMGRQLSESMAKAITPMIWAIFVHFRLEIQGNMTQARLFRTVVDQVRGVELPSKSRAILIQFLVILNLVCKQITKSTRSDTK